MLFKVLVVLCLGAQTVQLRSKIECGYKQCPQTREGALNVHLIAHSHMDAGWVKTYDEYYYGTRTSISTANVQLIYHSVLSELLHDKRRKFTFSETAYFWRWWKEQRPATRTTFRTLVQEGRIEFAGGGWVQNDEASLDYLQIIDHFTWGLRKLNDTLGPCGKPKAAWQIDTYGHTREQTSLLAQMGYDGLFIGRVDHKEREAMIEEDRMEFMWRGSDVLGKMSDIMTHTLYNLYNAPEGFCFDFLCSDEPIVDDPDNRVYNAEKRVNDFITQIERQAKYYDHDNIMVTMGGDFTYQSAANWFMNMDKLINHVNTHSANISDVNIFYSTPSCYLKAIYLYGRRDKAIFTEKDDLLPYGSDPNTYWVGFYSSRPTVKYLVKQAHAFLQVVKQLTVIARMGDSFELHLLRHAVNLLLHHDGITGTSQQHVANDFVRTLSEAIDACTKKVSTLLSLLTPTWGSRRSKNNQHFVICHQLNISQCRFTETQESMLLLVYNPHSVKTYHYVCMPANSLHYSIRDFNDEEVEYQLVPLPAAVINLPGRSSSAIQQLCFEAESIPPLGYTSFYISSMQDRLAENEYAKKFNGKQETDQDVSPIIYNEFIKVTVNKDTGLLESISHVDGVKVNVAQNFYYYDQASQAHQSGAYSFRPGKNRPTPVALKVTYHTIRGILVKEIRQRFADWITQIIRLYRGEEFVEVEWVVGPVPIGTDLGKEVVSIFSTNVSSGGTFFTDSNGRQMAQRTCWNQTTSQQQKKPVAACYYPVTSRICIQSQNASVAMCVLTDRTQGGTSYNEGEIELMVHRRLLTDDGFGLEEPLNEEAYGVGLVVKGTHRIMFGNYKQDVDEMSWEGRVSALSRRWRLQPWISVTSADKVSRRRWQNVRNKRYSLLRPRGLPRHVHILTLEPWKGGAVLLRLENTQEKPNRGPKPDKSENGKQPPIKPSHVTVQLRQLFVKLRIKMVRETTLAANQWLDDARQMDWSTRYVYNGADDDILAEDNIEYRDEAKVTKEAESKDTGDTVTVDITNYTIFQGRYSDEDEYTQTKPAKRPTHHMTSKDGKRITYDRKKRSAIPTVQSVIANVNENILNATFVEEKVNISTEIYRNTTTDVPILYINMSTTDKITRLTTKARHQPVTKGMARKILNSEWAKPARFFANLQIDNTSSSEEIASDEDISMNIKKRSSKKRNETVKKKKQETAIPEVSTSDDGITRSIFDMYYRPFTRLPTFTASVEYEGVPKTRIRDHKSRRFNNNEDLARGTAVSPGYSDRAAEERFKNNDDELARGTAVSPGYGDRATADRWRPYNKVINGESYSRRRSRHREKARERVKTDEKVYEDSGQLTERSRGQQRYGSKTFRAHVPFYPMNERDVRNKKRIQRAYSDSNEDEDMYTAWKVPARARDTMDERRDDFPEEADDDQDDDTDRTWRQKRATGEDPPITDGASQEPEQADQSEPDYIITLRPTQIRTFVIWFEPAKSPYVM